MRECPKMKTAELSALRHCIDYLLSNEREDFLEWSFRDGEIDESDDPEDMTEEQLEQCPHIYASALLIDKYLSQLESVG